MPEFIQLQQKLSNGKKRSTGSSKVMIKTSKLTVALDELEIKRAIAQYINKAVNDPILSVEPKDISLGCSVSTEGVKYDFKSEAKILNTKKYE
jgi:hypothetical protein